MAVITMAIKKGGSGKSTFTQLFASVLSNKDFNVVVIDADPSQRVYRWSLLSESDGIQDLPECLRVLPLDGDASKMYNKITELDEDPNVDFVLVDLEGTANTMMSFAVASADFVVIPCKGSSSDAEDAFGTIELIKAQSKVAGRDIPYSVCFSEVEAAYSTNVENDVRRDFLESGVKVLDSAVVKRVAFRETNYNGGILHDQAKSISGLRAAVDNSERVVAEVMSLLNIDIETVSKET